MNEQIFARELVFVDQRKTTYKGVDYEIYSFYCPKLDKIFFGTNLEKDLISNNIYTCKMSVSIFGKVPKIKVIDILY